jgi:hypothetical protein
LRQYCKAYHLADLRRFPGFREAVPPGGGPLADDTIVYVWDDLTVVASPVVPEEGVLWDAVSGDWEQFCRETLQFEIPEDLSDD